MGSTDATIGDLTDTIIVLGYDMYTKKYYCEITTPVRNAFFEVSEFDTFSSISKEIDKTIQSIYS